MKIFGKRTKKSSGESSAPVNQISEADRVLQELLRKDPKDLNAKQRRIVRRHKERTQEGGEEQVKEESLQTSTTDGPVVEEHKDAVPKLEDSSSKVENMEDETPSPEEKGDDASDDDTSSSDSDSDSSSDSDKEGEDDEEEEKVGGEEKNNDDANSPDDDNNGNKDGEVQDAPEVEDKEKAETTSSNMGKEEVLKMLEGLNSKQRRKLARQLEREGDEALDAVRDEALRLTKEAEEASKPAKDDTSTAAGEKKKQDTKATTTATDADTKTTKKGKKRKTDWSDLPAEERFRREEQRKKQKEAAERREQEANDPNASSKKFKHPLNSERRRANRRKPKWARKSQLNMEKNEHHSSGFHMRRMTKAGPN